jgi:hypothetical protein
MELPPPLAAAFPPHPTVRPAYSSQRLSIWACLSPDGIIDVEKYQQYTASILSRERCQLVPVLTRIIFGVGELHNAFAEHESPSKCVKSHSRRCVLARKDTKDGPLCIITPQEYDWYHVYIDNYLLRKAKSFMAKKFCNRFCFPYSSFLDLLDQVKSGKRFDRWCGSKTNGKKSSPVKLLLLGTLRYLGQGWTFDNIKEQTAISISVHRVFFHVFIAFGSTSFYSQHVLTPVHLAEAHSSMAEYTEAGFPGCVGWSDCTYITTEQCK